MAGNHLPGHLAAIEEAAQVLESAAAHNRAKGRTVLVKEQQDRADRLRAAHSFLTARRTPVADGAAVDLPPLPKPNAWRIGADGEWHYGSMNHCKRIRAEFEESFKDEPHEEPEGVYTAEQYQQGQREAISHYLRKQAGQVAK